MSVRQGREGRVDTTQAQERTINKLVKKHREVRIVGPRQHGEIRVEVGLPEPGELRDITSSGLALEPLDASD